MAQGAREEVRPTFTGSVVHALGWIVASMLGGLLFGAPLAWVNAGIARWVCRCTTFSDGSTAEFRGTGGDIVVWHVLLFLTMLGQQWAIARTAPDDYGSLLVIFFGPYLFLIGVALMLLKWFVHNLRILPGPHLTFTGSFPALLGWYFAILLSCVTIVGWAWVVVAMYQWIARNTKGEGVAFEFRATGLDFLWRALATVLGSVFLVTIPFLFLWFTRWMISQFALIRGVETEWGGFIEEQRTPQKPSWPAVPPLHRHLD